MSELTELIAACQAGDLQAYGRLVRGFQNMAHAYACALLGDFHLAEDAAQEAFVEAYQRLPSLRHPLAFPAWLRRIVLKHCDRATREFRPATKSLDQCSAIAAADMEPSTLADKREAGNRVLSVIGTLPEDQRDVITLFYMNEYSQRDIAQFLDVPVSTVKNRLFAARRKLKRRMVDMVEKSLQENTPGDRFSKRVIDRLLARPKLLDIKGHPVRVIWDEIRAALPDYGVIDGEEIEELEVAKVHGGKLFRKAYQVSEKKVLRTQTTSPLWQALPGRTLPVRLLTAGRVFRQDRQDKQHLKVFHQVDGVCIDRRADSEVLKATVNRLLSKLLAVDQTRWRAGRFEIVRDPQVVSVKTKQGWLDLAGAGMLRSETLRKAGYNPRTQAGFAFGLGIERLAMIRFGIDDIRTLWQPPYVPAVQNGQ